MTKNNKNKEDIDLGDLMSLINKVFNKIYSFFAGIFYVAISFLKLLKQNIIKITIVGAIGGAIGLYTELAEPTLYKSNLIVSPNFNSSVLLYNNIEYYNNLTKQKHFTKLAKTFKIDESVASSLVKFTIKPIKSENDIFNAYKNNIVANEKDTTIIKKIYPYKNFKESFTYLDYKLHDIEVLSNRSDVFKKLENTILLSARENNYFKRLSKLNSQNINRTDSLLRKDLNYSESLMETYIKIMPLEAKSKASNSTTISFGEKKMIVKELEIFNTRSEINTDLTDLLDSKTKGNKIINVISSFQPIGNKVSGVLKNYIFLYSALGIGLSILMILIIKLYKII